MITKSAALDRFINERVLGERGFAIQNGMCTYSHYVNGGCEIGQYLSDGDAAGLYAGSYKAIYERHPELFVGVFEEASDTYFWNCLQMCHDKLATYVDHKEQGDLDLANDYWQAFQMSLKATVDQLKGAH